MLAARKELARRSLPDFACMVDIPTVPLGAEGEEDRFSVLRLQSLAAHHQLLLRDLQAVESGRIPNLMVLMPPGSAKSIYCDVVFIPWFMARRERRSVILASYASDIAEKQGRRARQLISSRSFANLMSTGLHQDQKAAHQWALTNGSEFMAGGLTSGLTGNRAALGVLDDPVKGREDAESERSRTKTWDAYTDDFCSRLLPGAPQVLIQCMVGSTPVLMADGAEKPLRDVRAGDSIATYKAGRLAVSTVLNWINQGPDRVYEIRTSSGKIVRANERHPFLVETDEGVAWIRLRNLKIGNRLVRASSGANGAASTAPPTSVASQPSARATASPTTTRHCGPAGTARLQSTLNPGAPPTSDTATALAQTSIGRCTKPKAASAPSASNRPPRTFEHTGAESCALTTTTTPARFAAFCATTATSSSGTEKPRTCSSAPLDTYEITLDRIEAIAEVGTEEVFDIQVADTENFIANGLVSHNTRWHEDDVAGRILPEKWDGESGTFNGRDGRMWKVICLPAIADRADDPLGRQIGETLWPEWFSMEHWKPFQQYRRTWTSLYQQKPAPQEGTFFQRDWFRRFRKGQEPKHLNRYLSSDHAPAGADHSDYNCARVWGVDADGDLYLLDGFREQCKLDVLADKVIGNKAPTDEDGRKLPPMEGLLKKHKPFCWFPEDDNNWKAAAPFITRIMREQGNFVRIEPISPHGADKPTKAQSFQAMAVSGRVWIPEGPEGDEVIEQYLKFPAGTHDDEVDAASVIGRALDDAHPAIVPVKVADKFVDRWDAKFNDDESNDWKTA